ncbi:MAG: fibronectin type III domain-containing protein [Putridiphycobacter sp.]
MKNFLLTFLISFLAFTSFAQDNDSIVAVKFVDNDTIFIRFGYTNPETFKTALTYGLKIDRFEGSPQNMSSKTSFYTKPALEIVKDEKYSTNEKLKEIKALIEQYANLPSTAESNPFLYAILMLSSTTDKSYLEALGLIFYDTNFDATQTYFYQISLNSNQPNLTSISTTLEVNAKNRDVNPDFESLNAITKNKRKEVYLEWNAAEIGEHYSSFWVEKSKDSLHFETLNHAPIFLINSQYEKDKSMANYVDTAVAEGETYFYRITGINHFTESGGHSNIVKVRLNKSLNGIVKIDTVFANGMLRIISGEYQVANNNETDHLSHFILLRSDSLDKDYTVIDEKNLAANEKFKFEINSKVETGDRNYFKVAAISVDGDTATSMHYYFYTLDQIPPSQPNGLEGYIDEKGRVKLTWTKNPENDIKGYRVFWANDLNEEFVEATTSFINDSIFYDTISIGSLTPEIYYQVSAVDFNYNNSERSEPVKLTKPDTIPPVPCNFKSFKVTGSGVKLDWINSSSLDVQQNYLVRTTNSHAVTDTIFTWSDTTSSILDQDVEAGKIYHYQIFTLDKTPNSTESKTVYVTNETGVRPPVQNLEANISRKDKNISLQWIQDNSEVYSYKIYRSKNDGHFILYKTIKPDNQNTFVDKDLNINNTYSYKIKVVYKNGINSKFSETISVTY